MPRLPLARNWRWWLDVVPAVVVLTAGALGVTHIEPEVGDRPAGAVAYAVVAVAGTALLTRRRWPGWTLAVVAATLTVYTAARFPGGPVYLAGPVALYSLAVVTRRVPAYMVAAAMTAVLITARMIADGGGPSIFDLLFVAWAAAAVLAAEVRRGQAERAAAEREQRESDARRRLAEDRLHIARDLHDSVAHAMATINVQSGVAGHVLERHPEQAAAALEAIRTASRDVLDELGAMLDLLRDGDSAPRHPTPDLSDIDALVTSSRLAGLDVTVVTDGALDGLPAATGMASYRIVQEALTNVIRHAGATSASVTLRRPVDGGFDLDVVDDGAGAGPEATSTALMGAATNGTGMGLVGIRERAAITGGRCEIGPTPAGGFRVHVSWDELR